MMDSPYQEVPGTPTADNWASFYNDCRSSDAVVPSGVAVSYEDGRALSVPSTPVGPLSYQSPFVTPRDSPRPRLTGTPQQMLRLSGTPRLFSRKTPHTEQVVPSTPRGHKQTPVIFNTPTSTSKQALPRRRVLIEQMKVSNAERENLRKYQKSSTDTIVIDETGDHHRNEAMKDSCFERRTVAMQRRSRILGNPVHSRSLPDILDEINNSPTGDHNRNEAMKENCPERRTVAMQRRSRIFGDPVHTRSILDILDEINDSPKPL